MCFNIYDQHDKIVIHSMITDSCSFYLHNPLFSKNIFKIVDHHCLNFFYNLFQHKILYLDTGCCIFHSSNPFEI